GLPSGTSWYVNITGEPSSGAISGTSYSVSLPNGSYSYSVSTSNKEYSPSYTNPFTVNGNTVSNPITFSKVTYTVTFTESGLPSGTAWYVNITGTNKSSTSTTISFTEPNGTYSYTTGTTSNYTANISSGSIAVNGSSQNKTITFTATKVKKPLSPAPAGLSSIDIAIIGGVVAIAVIGSAVTIMMRR
ncbi:thermopsin precursor, partial [mine drainage metagenome]